MIDREKIIEILRASGYGYFITHEITNADEALADTADALIAAGIGDVSELKKHRVVVEKSLIPEDDNAYVLPNIPPKVKQLYNGEEVEKIANERDEYKHCAEVAERQAMVLSKWLAEKTRKDYPWQAWFDAAQKQAEKELAEEKTNKH